MFFEDAPHIPHTPEILKQLLIEKLASAGWYSSAASLGFEPDSDSENDLEDGYETDDEDIYDFGDYSHTRFTTLTFNNVSDTDTPILDSFAEQLSLVGTHGVRAGCHMPAPNVIQLGITVNSELASWFADLQERANQLNITPPNQQNTPP